MTSSPSPPELSALLAETDPARRDAAWVEFVRVYSDLILRVSRSMGGGHDAGMARYLHVLEQLQVDGYRRLRAWSADRRSRFASWLVVVVRRICLDEHRHRYGRYRRPGVTGASDEEARGIRRRLEDLVADDMCPEQIEDHRLDPEQELQRCQLAACLAGAIAGLAAEDRLLLRLRFEDELPAAQIAVILGYPTQFHVYRRLNRSFAILRSDLERQGIRDSVA